jgi:hypothetical protein
MATMTCTANDATFKAGQLSAEKLNFSLSLEDQVNDRGIVTAAPSHVTVQTSRVMPRETGSLTFLALAIASQRFNLLANQRDKHPVATFVDQEKRGRRTIDVYRFEISDFQADEYRLTWDGNGTDHLRGCTFEEHLTLIASAGKVALLIDNSEAAFDLR